MGSGISTPQVFNEKAHFDEQTLSERFPKFRDIKITNVIPQLGIPDQNYPRGASINDVHKFFGLLYPFSLVHIRN